MKEISYICYNPGRSEWILYKADYVTALFRAETAEEVVEAQKLFELGRLAVTPTTGESND